MSHQLIITKRYAPAHGANPSPFPRSPHDEHKQRLFTFLPALLTCTQAREASPSDKLKHRPKCKLAQVTPFQRYANEQQRSPTPSDTPKEPRNAGRNNGCSSVLIAAPVLQKQLQTEPNKVITTLLFNLTGCNPHLIDKLFFLVPQNAYFSFPVNVLNGEFLKIRFHRVLSYKAEF